MDICKLVTSLLSFIVMMFILTCVAKSNDQNVIEYDTLPIAENVPEKNLQIQESISIIKTRITDSTDLKSMDFQEIVEKIEIESFFDTLKNDYDCIYNSSSAFKESFDSSNLNDLKNYHKLLTRALIKYSLHVALTTDKREIKKIDNFFNDLESEIICLSYIFVIIGHNRRCGNISTMLYWEEVFKFGKTLEDLLCKIKSLLKLRGLEISEYIPPWIKAESKRIMKIQFQFGK